MPKITIRQIGTAGMLATVSVLAAINAVYMMDVGRADAINLKARDTLIGVKSQGGKIDEQSWQNLFDQFNEVASIAPGSPQLHEDLAYMYAIRSSVKTTTSESADLAQQVHANLEKAEAEYKTSIRLRPMASAAWANLALASFLLQRDDSAIATQIDRALDLGSNDAVTLIPLFFIMTHGGNQRFASQQSRLMEAFRGLRSAARQDVLKAMH
ncbi:hypothetical protein [Undibacterium sp. WLX3042]|uniref:hypothetical protein n=1 Tax=Undibacterium sp. WLX3042 TaxID=3412686 RepID=UPI003C2D25EB